MSTTEVHIYTDGSASNDAGGWGAVIIYALEEQPVARLEIAGHVPDTTNNRMELTAAIEALTALTRPCHVALISDSQYVVHGMSEWVAGWQANDWRTAKRKPVRNRDLWEQLVAIAEQHQVEWTWTQGHAGQPQNERADRLAQRAREVQLPERFARRTELTGSPA